MAGLTTRSGRLRHDPRPGLKAAAFLPLATAASIADIESRITAIQAAVEQSIAALRRIDGLVERISQSQTVVGAAIEEQSAVSEQIAGAAAGIALEVSETTREAEKISEVVAQVNERTERLLGTHR